MTLMSHELRTPLNGVIGLSDAMLRGAGGDLNEKRRHFMETIHKSRCVSPVLVCNQGTGKGNQPFCSTKCNIDSDQRAIRDGCWHWPSRTIA